MHEAYENTKIYKEKNKALDDKYNLNNDFEASNKAWL